MAQKQSRYVSRPKPAAASNPIVLGARFAAWLFWGVMAVLGLMIVSAVYWLLTNGAGS